MPDDELEQFRKGVRSESVIRRAREEIEKDVRQELKEKAKLKKSKPPSRLFLKGKESVELRALRRRVKEEAQRKELRKLKLQRRPSAKIFKAISRFRGGFPRRFAPPQHLLTRFQQPPVTQIGWDDFFVTPQLERDVHSVGTLETARTFSEIESEVGFFASAPPAITASTIEKEVA
ncbi:unnamed protein product, partial [marine sediment metagenome]